MFNALGMFGDLQKNLDRVIVEAEAGDGLVKVEATASKKIYNISIDPSLVNKDDMEELEDLIVVAINRAMKVADHHMEAEMQKMTSSFMPPNFDIGEMLGNLTGGNNSAEEYEEEDYEEGEYEEEK
ncbi:MAG: YbaB/EbfC family nucleoid-associated protein [Chitinophagales bacterium]